MTVPENKRQALLAVLRDTRTLLARPENDFSWSSWEDAGNALPEIDGLIAQIEVGRMPHWGSIAILYVPTGPIQEVSLSSGWGSAFLDIADRFDAAAAEE